MLNVILDEARVDLGELQKKYAKKLKRIAGEGKPDFATYEPGFEGVDQAGMDFKGFSHVIVVARGGSITSTDAMYRMLGWYQTDQRVYFCDSADPSYVAWLMRECPVADTLVITVSKSGTNVEHLENTFAFSGAGYKMLVITGEDDGNPLRAAALDQGWDVIGHPPIGGRYSGGTECALVPAAIMGLDAHGVFAAMRDAHGRFAPEEGVDDGNDALALALVMYEWEQRGYTEVFLPIYAVSVMGFAELASQLFHESVAKSAEVGQTIVPFSAPESRHHFSQRFYGGRKNIAGMFVWAREYADEVRVEVPSAVRELPLRDAELGLIDGMDLADSIEAERRGNWDDTIGREIPLVGLELGALDAAACGELMALLQYAAVYSSWLRDVNPFDQPAVESSKNLSFELRKGLVG